MSRCQTADMLWPDGFMWGTAASSTQCEGAGPASDWWDWERAGNAPLSGDGNGFGTQFETDFKIYAGLGLRHHRLSLDWSRLEPEPGQHDHAEIRRYRDLIAAAADAGLVPWLCLHHFTLPRWFAAAGGFLAEDAWREFWTRHVDFVADTFGDLAGGWQPVNETNYYGWLGYGGGRFPPGHKNPVELAAASEAIHLATAEAAVRLRRTGRPVASIYGLAFEVALDEHPATIARVSEMRADNWESWIGLFRDGVLRIRGREPVTAAHLTSAFDLIGFSYYRTVGVRNGRVVPFPEAAPLSDMGYAIHADGLRLVLDRLNEELPATPLLVAEYGVGTKDDAIRAEYLTSGLQIAHSALERGIDLRGFFCWTGVDNYEWLRGFDVQFGIIDAHRNVRPSAQVVSREAR